MSCVTRGIRVTASALYAPEMATFAYSIRLALVAPGEEGHLPAAQRGFETAAAATSARVGPPTGHVHDASTAIPQAQLHTRHWVLRQADGGADQARGKGGRGGRSATSAEPLPRRRALLSTGARQGRGRQLPAAARGRLARQAAPLRPRAGHVRDTSGARHHRRDDKQRHSGRIGQGEWCEGVFVYQSLSGRGSSISFEGSIDFVPGSLEAPAGEEFAVAVPRFPLLVGADEYLF